MKLYHLDTSVSLSLSFKVSVAACCWRCLWGCPVLTGSRPPCCPPPRESYGPGSEGPAAGPSSRSRSSTLGPSLRRRARKARSCPRPAMEEPVRRGFRCGNDSTLMLMTPSYHKYLTWPTGLFGNHENRVQVRVSHLMHSEELWLLKDWPEFL